MWEEILNIVKARISAEEFGRWLTPLQPVGEPNDGQLLLKAPNRFFVDWIQDHYLVQLEEAASQSLGRPMMVSLSISDTPRERPIKPPLPPREQALRDTPSPYQINLNPGYTFNNFVIGECNRFAHAAAFAVANLPGQTYNPLFVYSGVGLGKTHLMTSIGNHILAGHPQARIAYTSCETFTNQMIQAIRDKSMDLFREYYRRMDVLLIDDIQFLGNKERTQEEFFFTFNALYDTGRQIVITSDQKPKDIPGIEDRLTSRFEWGLIADIQTPDVETKAAIVHKKAEQEGIELPQEVAYKLASSEESNIRVIEGFLTRLAAHSSMTNQPISMDLTNKVLKDAFVKKEVKVDDVIRIVGLRYSVRLADLKSQKKQKSIAEPRQIAMYLAREMTGSTLVRIGQKFGGRDHSTVIHAVNKIKTRLGKDAEFKRDLALLRRSIQDHD